MGADDEDGPAGLDQQRLVAAKPLQRRDKGVDVRPRSGRSPPSAVDDEPGRVFGHSWIEHVQEAAQHALLLPSAALERQATRCGYTLACADLCSHASTILPW